MFWNEKLFPSPFYISAKGKNFGTAKTILTLSSTIFLVKASKQNKFSYSILTVSHHLLLWNTPSLVFSYLKHLFFKDILRPSFLYLLFAMQLILSNMYLYKYVRNLKKPKRNTKMWVSWDAKIFFYLSKKINFSRINNLYNTIINLYKILSTVCP